MVEWDGERYAAQVQAALGDGHPHGEADFVERLGARRVLDAGCGTGRVAIELHRRGIDVVGVDVSASMLATARRLDPTVAWCEADLETLDLPGRFDVIVMAGNVLLFTRPGTNRAVIERCAGHLATGGCLVTGFQLERGFAAADLDADAAAAGLVLDARFATWEGDPFDADADFVVSVHRPAKRATP